MSSLARDDTLLSEQAGGRAWISAKHVDFVVARVRGARVARGMTLARWR